MAKEMLINVSEGEECRIALVEDGRLEELYMERTSSTSHVGNIYTGRVTNVEASIQAAFVDFGLGRNGFLHVSDLLPDYFGKKGEDVEEFVGKKMARRDRPPIQRCLRRGDKITVQVIKEGIGTKGPTLSSYLSVSGKMLVMMPGVSGRGVSRKIEDEQERRRLKQILDSLDPPEDCGFILRTEAFGKTRAEIERDLSYLARLWANMKRKRDSANGPVELYTEGDLVTRTIRDLFSADVDRLVVDSETIAEEVRDVIRMTSPKAPDRVEAYTGPIPLFHKYGIERDIELMYSRHVPLPSGGSLVIDSTEAVVAIDVNSGKFREHNDAEMTAFKTDMEAADEICRQLRVRDLGGVIICDFIDLRYERNRRELEERIVANFKKDRAKTKVLRMSQFGIIEITRQRMRPSLKKSVYFDCPQCKGAGLVKTPESMGLDVMRRLAIALNDPKVVRAELGVCHDVAFYLSNKKRRSLADLEDRTSKEVTVRTDPTIGLDEMKLDLFDDRDGMVLVPELADTLTSHPHTSQLNVRQPGQSSAGSIVARPGTHGGPVGGGRFGNGGGRPPLAMTGPRVVADARRDEPRKEEPRKPEPRRDEGRRDESRRDEGRREPAGRDRDGGRDAYADDRDPPSTPFGRDDRQREQPRGDRDQGPARDARDDRPQRDDRTQRDDRPPRDDRGQRNTRGQREDRDAPVGGQAARGGDRPGGRSEQGGRGGARDDRGGTRDDRGGDRQGRQETPRDDRRDRDVRNDRDVRGDRDARADRDDRAPRDDRDDRGGRQDRGQGQRDNRREPGYDPRQSGGSRDADAPRQGGGRGEPTDHGNQGRSDVGQRRGDAGQGRRDESRQDRGGADRGQGRGDVRQDRGSQDRGPRDEGGPRDGGPRDGGRQQETRGRAGGGRPDDRRPPAAGRHPTLDELPDDHFIDEEPIPTAGPSRSQPGGFRAPVGGPRGPTGGSRDPIGGPRGQPPAAAAYDDEDDHGYDDGPEDAHAEDLHAEGFLDEDARAEVAHDEGPDAGRVVDPYDRAARAEVKSAEAPVGPRADDPQGGEPGDGRRRRRRRRRRRGRGAQGDAGPGGPGGNYPAGESDRAAGEAGHPDDEGDDDEDEDVVPAREPVGHDDADDAVDDVDMIPEHDDVRPALAERSDRPVRTEVHEDDPAYAGRWDDSAEPPVGNPRDVREPDAGEEDEDDDELGPAPTAIEDQDDDDESPGLFPEAEEDAEDDDEGGEDDVAARGDGPAPAAASDRSGGADESHDEVTESVVEEHVIEADEKGRIVSEHVETTRYVPPAAEPTATPEVPAEDGPGSAEPSGEAEPPAEEAKPKRGGGGRKRPAAAKAPKGAAAKAPKGAAAKAAARGRGRKKPAGEATAAAVPESTSRAPSRRGRRADQHLVSDAAEAAEAIEVDPEQTPTRRRPPSPVDLDSIPDDFD